MNKSPAKGPGFYNEEVANALGAIVGSVTASCSIEIKPDIIAGGTNG